jgi:NADH:ubiquinone oxidoreductase subunit 3 (subunit A)
LPCRAYFVGKKEAPPFCLFRKHRKAGKVLKIKQKYKSKMIEYLSILIYFIIASLLALLILGLSFVFATRKADPEKISAYECGFDPFDDARSRFDVQFYLVAILFIIFDLEVTFLFPWALTLSKVGFFGFWSMMVFLLILTVGFVYEWRKGALDWS